NPRYAFGVYTLSRRAPSTARPPLLNRESRTPARGNRPRVSGFGGFTKGRNLSEALWPCNSGRLHPGRYACWAPRFIQSFHRLVDNCPFRLCDVNTSESNTTQKSVELLMICTVNRSLGVRKSS